jgi:exopolysaccharide biosynthesis WecB/TagA/CpsF family protein
MIDIVEIILLVVVAALLVPLSVVSIECVAALFARRSARQGSSPCSRPTIGVLIPACDEASVIARTLVSVRSNLGENDRIVVIADNCRDETAVVARSYGVEVWERREPLHRGKGYAIEYGLRSIASNPPDVVIMLDADCVIERGDLEQLAQTAADTGRPVQAVYLMNPPHRATGRDILSAFAFCVRNLVRPLGLHALGLPCLLTGSGMAFPWSVLRSVGMRGESIVEDMQLAVDMIRAGHPPILCPHVVVRSGLPSQSSTATKQRTRWEHGHLRTMFTAVPKLLATAMSRRKFGAAALAVDLSVPPLSLLVILIVIVALAAIGVGLVGGSWTALMLLLLGTLVAATTLAGAWLRFARHEIGARDLLAAPAYLLWKLPIYLRYLGGPQTGWTKTSREAAPVSLTPEADNVAVVPSGACDIVDLPTISLRNVRLHSITEDEVIDAVVESLQAGNGGWIITANLQHLWQCEKDAEYRSMVDEADLVVADGMPLLWAGALQGTPMPQRVAGSDLVSSLTSAAAEHGRSIFLLGGAEDSADVAASMLQSRYPQLQVAGTCAPEYGFENDPAQIDRIGDMLVAAAPDIIYVALGSPKQERLIRELRGRLPSAWWIGVGISFSFVAGHVKRAPRWMQRYGLEWMHRLAQEPRRLARRYLVQGLPFAARVLISSTVNRWRVAEAQPKRGTSASSDRAALRRCRPPARTTQSGSSRSLGRQRAKQPSGDQPANRPTR